MNNSIWNIEFDEKNPVFQALQIQAPSKGQKITLEAVKEILIVLMKGLDRVDNMDCAEQYAGTREQHYQQLKQTFLSWKKIYQQESIFHNKDKDSLITIGGKK